ncbi:transcription-repair coupling factor [Neisseria gonorrhoeae]|uniref:Transcription-repair coupling factor n=1 Tax=Neisseria gonorrhoeae TaxID=485 RepID=A0A378VXG5_NEIGO|nr:transcription-repair coupling factor [Neisseria gonorrhoeae]
MRERLETLLPEARIGVAHGQLRERELEQVMRDFLQQRFNVLLCSTIIETGIDIPNANTIIINRADKFGLAQLHQLRGRVGRSHHQAYAYLLTPEYITKDAEKRLDAIAAADELGAGFTLAMQDLEIRGAGEILGEGQSGEMMQVGFTLYTEMLKQAVRDLKKAANPTSTHRWALPPKSNCTARHYCLKTTAPTSTSASSSTNASPYAKPCSKSTPYTKNSSTASACPNNPSKPSLKATTCGLRQRTGY